MYVYLLVSAVAAPLMSFLRFSQNFSKFRRKKRKWMNEVDRSGFNRGDMELDWGRGIRKKYKTSFNAPFSLGRHQLRKRWIHSFPLFLFYYPHLFHLLQVLQHIISWNRIHFPPLYLHMLLAYMYICRSQYFSGCWGEETGRWKRCSSSAASCQRRRRKREGKKEKVGLFWWLFSLFFFSCSYLLFEGVKHPFSCSHTRIYYAYTYTYLHTYTHAHTHALTHTHTHTHTQ